MIQSRLSGILVPLIIFYIKPYAMVHPLNKMLSILSTLYMNSWRHSIFCHTAQNRYMFKAAGIRATAPRLVFSGPTPLLLDPKAMVEHVNLTKAVIQTGQRNNYRHRKGKAYSLQRNITRKFITKRTNATARTLLTRTMMVVRRIFARAPSPATRENVARRRSRGPLILLPTRMDKTDGRGMGSSNNPNGFQNFLPSPTTTSLSTTPSDIRFPTRPITHRTRDTGTSVQTGHRRNSTRLPRISVTPLYNPQENGEQRPVLNLRPRNQYIQPKHFKM